MEFGFRTRLIELAGEITTAMPEYVVEKVAEALNDSGKPAKGARVLIVRLAYKPNVDDDRESATYEIMELLERRKPVVSYNDPHVPEIRPGRSHHQVAGRMSQPITPTYDVIVLCTNHREYSNVDFDALDGPLVDCRDGASKRPRSYYPA